MNHSKHDYSAIVKEGREVDLLIVKAGVLDLLRKLPGARVHQVDGPDHKEQRRRSGENPGRYQPGDCDAESTNYKTESQGSRKATQLYGQGHG